MSFKHVTWPLALLVCALQGCDREQPPPPPRIKEVFHLNNYEKDFGYAQAVLIDKTLYVSASVSADAQGRLIAPGDMEGQLRATYTNVKHTLEAHGVSFEQVVKETVYVTDMDAFLKAKAVRMDFYDKDRMPAAAWLQVQRLVDPGFLVAVEVVAELP
jgi:2-iminobutanoate/2-iminopropanoate deaminase